MNKQANSIKTSAIINAMQIPEPVVTILNRLINKLVNYTEQYSDYSRCKKALRELAKLDTHMLKDIGIDKADVIQASMVTDLRSELKRLNDEKLRKYNKRVGVNSVIPPTLSCPCD